MRFILQNNPQLVQEIVELLHPHMSAEDRQTLLTPLFLGYDAIYSKIDWSGSNKEFTVQLVKLLIGYGEVEVGQQAISVVLQALRAEVGLGDQQKIDDLLTRLRPNPSPKAANPHPMPSKTNHLQKRNASQNKIAVIGVIVIGTIALFLFWLLSPPPPTSLPTAMEITTVVVVNSTLTPTSIPFVDDELPTETTTIAEATSTHTHTPSPSPTATATPSTPQIGTTRISPRDDANYLYVPAGEFLMGSSDDQVELMRAYCGGCSRSRFAHEQPQKSIYLDAFWIMQTEVTVAQYRKFMVSQGYTNQGYWSEEGWRWKSGFLGLSNKSEPENWDDQDWRNQPSQPVVGVSWYEAEAYADWLSQETGLAYQLPTEAQWEKAARGTDAQIFPWGNLWDVKKANSESEMDGYTGAAPVGAFPLGASPYGALDMAGNVLEWTLDAYDDEYYTDMDARNPVSRRDVMKYTVRGGAWNNSQYAMRTAYRHPFDRGTQFNNVGFRLVMILPDFEE